MANTFTRLKRSQEWVVCSDSAGLGNTTVLVERNGKSPRGVVLGQQINPDIAEIPERAQGKCLYRIDRRLSAFETQKFQEGQEQGRQGEGQGNVGEGHEGQQEGQEGQEGQTEAEQKLKQIQDLLGQNGVQLDDEKLQQMIDEAVARVEIPEHRITVNVEAGDDIEVKEITDAHECLADVLINVGVGNHVYLVGPAGSGKTFLASQVADSLDRTLYTVGALLTKYEAIGYQTATGEYVTTACREAFEHGGVLLWDEVDASAPAALVALNAMLANGEYTFPDKTVKRHPEFVVIAAGNTFGTGATREYVGRLQLDAATLDRFAFIEMDYDKSVEGGIAEAEFKAHGGEDKAVLEQWLKVVRFARDRVREHKLRHVVSPRASIMGARLLARGFCPDKAFKQIIAKGASDDVLAKIKLPA